MRVNLVIGEDVFRVCSRCKQAKKINGFSIDRCSSDGLAYHCKKCQIKHSRQKYYRNHEQSKAYAREWAKNNPERSKYNSIKSKYGLSKFEWDALLEASKGCCGICGEYFGHQLCIDHNHETGTVRGLLCSPCNAALGFFKDNIESLNAAIDYLRR